MASLVKLTPSMWWRINASALLARPIFHGASPCAGVRLSAFRLSGKQPGALTVAYWRWCPAIANFERLFPWDAEAHTRDAHSTIAQGRQRYRDPVDSHSVAS